MAMKQTAVEWLVEKLKENGVSFWQEEIEMIEEAKEIEKEQIKISWVSAWQDSMVNPLEYKYYEPEAEQYYKETFKSE
jgi:hypothetical protein